MLTSHTDFYVGRINEKIRAKWGWFLALGIALVSMGILAFANLLTATTLSILYVGALMIIGGIIQIAHSFQIKSWSGFLFFISSGILYSAAGILAFQNPLLAATTLTFLLALALIFSGSVRIWSGFTLRPEFGWGWTLASGMTTLIVGIVFILGWPINSLWLLGMLLAIDLTFQGVASVGLGITLRIEKFNVWTQGHILTTNNGHNKRRTT